MAGQRGMEGRRFRGAMQGVPRVSTRVPSGRIATVTRVPSASATVRLGVAANRAVEFLGCCSTGGADHSGVDIAEFGVADEWTMIVFRGAVENAGATVKMQTAHLTRDDTALYPVRTKTPDFPRATFAKDARVRIMGMVLVQEWTEAPIYTWGAKLVDGWLTDAEIEQIRDKDAAEMDRRKMFPTTT